ncbi:zinc ribbon domain-containing protein [Eubacteriales bacterium OttesenSCG-928-A19]|nr:zinc ribbon domain-containing protein [Eubacteriales bacterium OttesenSCG-928-A19]
MKCPRCGHWNKSSFPHCFQCGEPLNARAEKSPAWRQQFERPQKEKQREVFDDTKLPVEHLVEPEPEKPRPRRRQAESLSAEMTRLKDRRARGAVYLEQFRQNAAEQGIAPSGSGVSIRRGSRFFDGIPDDPEHTVSEPREAFYGEAEPEVDDIPPLREDTASYPRGAARLSSYQDTFYGQAENPYALYDEDLPPVLDAPGAIAPHKKKRTRRIRGPIVLSYALVGALVLGVVAFGVYAVASYILPTLSTQRASTEVAENYTLEKIDMDGLTGHRVTISGEEGAQVYIAELMRSFVIVDGKATIDVADHVFYDMIEPLDVEVATMDVSLTPTINRNGVETRLDAIRYTIDIPESQIILIEPETKESTVNASIFTIKIDVAPNSRVLVNGKDESDKVDENGRFTHNASVQAIGSNIVAITVRAPYCRENILNITLYRAPMDIPIELDAATLTNTTDEQLTIYGTTMVGATITVDSPTFWVNTGNEEQPGVIQEDGKFSLAAKMTRVGTNKVIIRANYPGKAESTLEHAVYWLPSAAEYTPKAWALSAQDYSEMMNNIQSRIDKAQIYLCQGVIKEIFSENPQMVIMDTGKDGREQLVFLQNESQIEKWVLGKQYRVYADVSGVYTNMPRLIGRYAYEDEPEPTEAPEDAAIPTTAPETDDDLTAASEPAGQPTAQP